ncbi:hypothetical protein [Azohydromonas aeria]|uniref:hypothetical protein n=1 Tax=Azohydromonas aeria TaxID=2590212 RepID=UPI0012F7D1AD|nr:hypothetical protein [Azohydromonas aeria]
MRSKFLVLAVSLAGAATAAKAAPAAATPAPPASATSAALVPVATQAAALAPRDDGVDAAAAATGTGITKPAEPDPAQSPFPVQDTLLLLAGLLAMGYVVKRRG